MVPAGGLAHSQRSVLADAGGELENSATTGEPRRDSAASSSVERDVAKWVRRVAELPGPRAGPTSSGTRLQNRRRAPERLTLTALTTVGATHDPRAADARSRHDYAALPQPAAMVQAVKGHSIRWLRPGSAAERAQLTARRNAVADTRLVPAPPKSRGLSR